MLAALKARAINTTNQRTPWYLLLREPVAALVRMPWWLFVLSMGLIYVGEILFFALLLWPDSRHLVGMAPMGIDRAIAFSFQNFLSASFGNIAVDSPYTHFMAVTELIAGLVTTSSVTAIVFLKLSSNETPLIFSDKICISNLEDGHLFCRFVTIDPSSWLDVHYSLSLILDDEIEPGLWQRRIHPLTLLNAGTPQLSQTATLTHPITPDSPLHALGLDGLSRRHAVLMPLVEGVDEVTGAGLLQTHLYRFNDLQVGQRFADVVVNDPSGKRRVNLKRLHHTIAVTSETR